MFTWLCRVFSFSLLKDCLWLAQPFLLFALPHALSHGRKPCLTQNGGVCANIVSHGQGLFTSTE